MRHGTYAYNLVLNPGGAPTAYDTLPGSLGPIRTTITRGRPTDLQSVAMGTCMVTLVDEAGVFNPANASSPLVSAGQLKPMRKLTMSITPTAGAATAVYTGYLSRLWANPDATVQTATLEFVDGLIVLERSFPIIASTGITRVGTQIAALLTASGIAGGDMDVSAGRVLLDFETDGTLSARQVISDLQAIDQGAFYYSAAGKYTYRDRDQRVGRNRPAVVATLTSTAVAAQVPGFDVTLAVNEQSALAQRLVGGTVEDVGTVQTISDTTYLGFRQAGALVESVYLRDQVQANSLAQHVVATRKTGDVPTRDVVLPGLTLAQIQQQTLLELTDAVTLSGLGVSSTGIVESMRHDITRDQHATTYVLTSWPGYGFTIGVSTISGADPIAY